jgi:hypothetical protein
MLKGKKMEVFVWIKFDGNLLPSDLYSRLKERVDSHKKESLGEDSIHQQSIYFFVRIKANFNDGKYNFAFFSNNWSNLNYCIYLEMYKGKKILKNGYYHADGKELKKIEEFYLFAQPLEFKKKLTIKDEEYFLRKSDIKPEQLWNYEYFEFIPSKNL